MENIIKLRIFI